LVGLFCAGFGWAVLCNCAIVLWWYVAAAAVGAHTFIPLRLVPQALLLPK
jgi:hypothetical protein